MRILFVHERFGALGGAESNARLTAAALAQRGHEIGLLHGPSTGKDEQTWKQVFPARFSLPSSSPRQPVREALEGFDPAVLYVHKLADLDAIEALLAGGRPLVRMVHDHDIYCMKSYKYAFFSRRICQRSFGPHCLFPCGAFFARSRDSLLPVKFVSYTAKKRELELNRRFDQLIVVSRYMRQELLGNGFSPGQIRVLAPVPAMGDQAIRSSFSDRNLILFAGQIIRGKGVDVLLEALSLVTLPFECRIVGDGNHRAYCERLCRKLGLSKRVTFHGFVPQPALIQFYRECSVVAVSSVWPEPIGTIGLEAMRYALPIVAFDAGGIEDWLLDGQNGYLVSWMDRRQFATRLEQLLADKPLARSMGERGCQLAAERFGFDQYIANLENLFVEVCRNPRRNGGV
ncbi:MAG: glycosyltransferase family 4 protein [Verrucomicrobiota bacterium]